MRRGFKMLNLQQFKNFINNRRSEGDTNLDTKRIIEELNRRNKIFMRPNDFGVLSVATRQNDDGLDVLVFPTAVESNAYGGNLQVPDNFEGKRINASIIWMANNAAAGVVAWQLEISLVRVGSIYSVKSVENFAVSAAAGTLVAVKASKVLAQWNIKAGDILGFRMERLGGLGDDTYGADAKFILLVLEEA